MGGVYSKQKRNGCLFPILSSSSVRFRDDKTLIVAVIPIKPLKEKIQEVHRSTYCIVFGFHMELCGPDEHFLLRNRKAAI
jgi:hypothetical protein